MLKHYNFKFAADLYYNIAVGKIDPLDVKLLFTERIEESAKRTLEELMPKSEVRNLTFDGGDDFLVIDNNLKNLNFNSKIVTQLFQN